MTGALAVLGLFVFLLGLDAAVRNRHRISRWLDEQLFMTVCGCTHPQPADPTVLSRCRNCGHLWDPSMSANPDQENQP